MEDNTEIDKNKDPKYVPKHKTNPFLKDVFTMDDKQQDKNNETTGDTEKTHILHKPPSKSEMVR